jgi:hypothetical protein
MFSNILNLCSSLWVGEQVSHPQHEVSLKKLCKQLKLRVSEWLFSAEEGETYLGKRQFCHHSHSCATCVVCNHSLKNLSRFRKNNINSRALPSKNSISSCISNKLEADENP